MSDLIDPGSGGRVQTITVRRDSILHLGLPYSVAIDGMVIARFLSARNTIAYAHACHRAAWGRDATLVVEDEVTP